VCLARRVRAVLVIVALAACGDGIQGDISISTPPVWRAAISEFVALTDDGNLSLGEGGDFEIHLGVDPALPAEAYRIERNSERRYIVFARDVLGAQFGLSGALENLGYRFRHPFETFVPNAPRDHGAELGVIHEPATRVRGLQLHTLHPIEGYFAFWEPSPGSVNDARRIIDWLVKNRGNYVQWVALDDIMDQTVHGKWKAHTQELIDYAHIRGVRVGLNIQLFGGSNLQNAFDLHDDDRVSVASSIAARLPLVTQELPFDVYDLSFGEFFSEEPQRLIDSINEFAHQARVLAPQAELHGFVHVGAKQRVDYNGENLLYYFLLKYADPSIVPDIHTVMYFNLFDDAGGAYQHDTFDEHRAYLVGRMCAGKPHAYLPESGYWIAFDNTVPTYVPLYVYSRWRDVDGLAQTGCTLDSHILFTTGWEWGYWLNDSATLRTTYERAASPEDLIADALAPDLGAAASVVSRLVAEQKRALIDERLAAYIASRGADIDLGRMLQPPIISQPDRVLFEEIVAGVVDAAQFETKILEPLAAHAHALDRLDHDLDALDLPDSRWTRELRDGFEIDRLRARFIHDVYAAVIAHTRGEDSADLFENAEALLAAARNVVARRHADLHDTHRRRLVDKTTNKTFYQYGYLHHADILCFWQRELDQVGAILGNTTTAPPACLF
jgi:hypothetical protein